MKSKIDAQAIIQHFGLESLPREGGMFSQSYRSADILDADQLPARYDTSKPAGTAIYYLLTAEEDSFSAMHRLVVPRGVWQGSRLAPGGQFALLGTTMAPGWTDDDYEEGGYAKLAAEFPEQANLINSLTRTD